MTTMKDWLVLASSVLLIWSSCAATGAETSNFGDVHVGSDSAPITVTGFAGVEPGCTVSVSGFGLSGNDTHDFYITESHQQQTANQGRVDWTASVVFKPSSTGVKWATLIVTMVYNGCSFPTSMHASFTGNGVAGTQTNPGIFDPQAGVPSTLPPVVQSVTPAGTATNLSLSSQMKFDSSISGQQGSIFVGARVPPYATASGLTGGRQAAEMRQPQDATTETWYISNGTSWGQLGNTIPAHFTGALSDANAVINILNGANIAGLCGTEFYVGYGTSSSAMLANNTLGKVYTVMCNFDFTGSVSGSLSGLTLTASAQVATADAGKSGNFYVGRLLNNQWTLHNGSGWVNYNGGAIPVYSNGVLSSRQIQVFNNENVQSLTGAQIFAGYGLDDSDLLSNNKYKLVHTIQ